MVRFLFKILLFVAINVPIFFLVADFSQMRFYFTNDTSESVLLVMPREENYDLLFLGTSHVRIFSRNGNRSRIEKILSQRMFNLGKAGGHGGVLPEYLLLSRFFEEGNKVHTLVYFLDPWVFYSPLWNEKNYFLEDEPFDIHFVADAIKEGASKNTIINHLQSKLTPWWFLRSPATLDSNTSQVSSLSATREACRIEIVNSYMDGLNHENFLRYTKILEQTVDLAERNGSHVIFIFPTTLCRDVLGKKEMQSFLKELSRQHNIETYDFSGTMTDPKYFYDYNHLNSEGVEVFTEKYLKPILGGTTLVTSKKMSN